MLIRPEIFNVMSNASRQSSKNGSKKEITKKNIPE
jgi:hypothetical protein